MPSLYVTRPGSRIARQGDRLHITKDEVTLLDVALRRLDNIVCFGEVHITTAAIHSLLREGIDFAFLSRSGRYRGRLAAPHSKNVYLRAAQYEKSANDLACLSLARAVVNSKLGNMAHVLRRFSYNHRHPIFPETIRKLEKLGTVVESAAHCSRLLGLEGLGSKLYFQAFGKMMLADLQFTKRTRKPPTDPVNALLSLTYVMVANEMVSILESMGFDPHVGFFHSVGYGKPSLALDLIEPFRSALCDTHVARLCNLRILEEKDFLVVPNREGKVILKETPFETFLEHYEKRMTKEFLHPTSGKRVNWRDCLRLEGENLRSSLLKGTLFQPFCATS